jgi:hypothetical protein
LFFKLLEILSGLFISDPGSRSWFFTHPGSRNHGSKRHRIPDPGSGSATLVFCAADLGYGLWLLQGGRDCGAVQRHSRTSSGEASRCYPPSIGCQVSSFFLHTVRIILLFLVDGMLKIRWRTVEFEALLHEEIQSLHRFTILWGFSVKGSLSTRCEWPESGYAFMKSFTENMQELLWLFSLLKSGREKGNFACLLWVILLLQSLSLF